MSHRINSFKGYLGLLFLLSFTSCGVDIPEEVAMAYDKLPAVIDYNIDIKPIISDRCYQCHGPDEQTRGANLRLDNKEGLFQKTENGSFPFVPGDLNNSEVIHRILSDDPEYVMPSPESNHTLSDYEKAAIIKWVEQEGKWKEHWAFIPPEKSQLPVSVDNLQQNNEIDLFIQEKLGRVGLKPSEEADKSTLLRRVTIELTGLPPAIEDMEAFINDQSDKAYEKVVDRLLNSEAHAERMTLEWLDVSRYADSHGFHVDGLRTMWPWRDWVINAFKENKRYDEFVSEQLAGDLMPNATKQQIIATAFNRNHPMTAEGGAVDEEYRVEYVTNRTNTLGTAFLGLTVECAKCHDHKFDPISQKEYYQLSAFFNNVRELGMTANDGDFGPMINLSDEKTDKEIAAISRSIEELERIHVSRKKELLTAIKSESQSRLKKVRPVMHHSFEVLTKTDSSEFLDGKPNTVQSNTDSVEGIAGKARYFNHQDDGITIKNSGQFEYTDAFSVSVWVKPDDETGHAKTIVGNSGFKSMLYRGWDFYLDTTRNVAVRLISRLPHDYIHVKTEKVVPLNVWTHMLFSYDGSASSEGINIYINGELATKLVVYDRLEKSILPEYTYKKRDLNHAVRIGKSYRGQTGDNGVFKGTIDELSIFDREIFEPQVLSLYEQSKKGGIPTIDDVFNDDFLDSKNRLVKLRTKRLNLVDTISELMVMKEMQKKRPTYILNRGVYDAHGEQVEEGTPQKVLYFGKEFEPNRLGLSKWLFDERNPLTARVAVNRYWQMIFGRGIVRTANDFGNQGALPTHKELLDWMAVEFMESGWDVKALMKLMVTSKTYKQSSNVSEEQLENDEANIWLARSSSYRWQAEFIRDNALASSGLLNEGIGGESTKPFQPEGLWIEKGNFSHDLLRYKRDKDEKQYRRSMYTFIRRTSPPPFMELFDAPSREVCTITRERTNTPLQSLVLLNDPQFLEASRALAFRIKKESGDSLNDKIETGFMLTLSRPPSDKEVEIFKTLYQEEVLEFEKEESELSEYLSIGDFNANTDFDPIEMAALTVLSNTLFNMDEAFVKR
jgi:hypothetical protein